MGTFYEYLWPAPILYHFITLDMSEYTSSTPDMCGYTLFYSGCAWVHVTLDMSQYMSPVLQYQNMVNGFSGTTIMAIPHPLVYTVVGEIVVSEAVTSTVTEKE